MYPHRLEIQELPAELHTKLRSLVTSQAHQQLDVEAPFIAQTIGHIPQGDAADVETAVNSARQAQLEWAQTPFAYRRKIFHAFQQKVLEHRELLMDMVQLETGKNRASAFDEIIDVVSTSNYYARNVEKLLSPQKRSGLLPVLSRTEEHRYPLGVVGQISPWNYPLTLAISDAIPALLAGNAVVAKPDSATAFTALLIVSLLYDAGLPRELFHTVTGDGSVVGAAIAQQCDFLMFTGSTRTGRILGETTGQRLIGYSAELGGKNPLIVAADADLDKAVAGAVHGTLSNSGQLCVSIERIFVVETHYSQFIESYVERIGNTRIGAGLDWDIEMGSLASQKQLDTVEAFVHDARVKGANILSGGTARPDLGPYFFEPTVITGATEEMDLYRNEVFGPVVYVQAVADLAEAIYHANDSSYGLNAAIFAAPDTARAVAPLLKSGGVNINDAYASSWANIDTPLGGAKDSGLSARHGATGLLKYTQSQNISEQKLMPLAGPAKLSRRTYAAATAAGLRLLTKIRR